MSNTRTNTLERNGHSNKGTNKLGSPWSRAIASNSEWNDKVRKMLCDGHRPHGQSKWFFSFFHFCSFVRNVGWIFGRGLLVTTSAGHHNRYRLGHHSTTRFYRNHTVSSEWYIIQFHTINPTIFFAFHSYFVYGNSFTAINCGIVYLYCMNFQKIDEDEYGGIWELLKEGLMTSFACFCVTWIVFFTGLHFDDVSTPRTNFWKWPKQYFNDNGTPKPKSKIIWNWNFLFEWQNVRWRHNCKINEDFCLFVCWNRFLWRTFCQSKHKKLKNIYCWGTKSSLIFTQ